MALFNLARMTTATTGTGTITLGSAVSGFLTFALAGVANGDTVSYAIRDGANSEIGTGVYTSSGTTLTRTPTKSTNSDAAISLSGSAQVFITPRAEDIITPAGLQAFWDSKVFTATATCNFASMATGVTATDIDITVTGASAGYGCYWGVTSGFNAGLIIQAFSDTANKVTMRCTNASTGTIDPTAKTVRAVCVQP